MIKGARMPKARICSSSGNPIIEKGQYICWEEDGKDIILPTKDPFIDDSKFPPQILKLWESEHDDDKEVAKQFYFAAILQPVVNEQILLILGDKCNGMGLTALQEECNGLRSEIFKLRVTIESLQRDIRRFMEGWRNG